MSSQITPIQFTNTLGLETLRLTSDEFQQITTAFVKRRHAQGNQFFTIPPLVQEAILNLSGGHAGLCRITLKKIWEKFRSGGSDIEILEYLVSSNFRGALQSTRAFIWIEDWNPTVKESQFIRDAFLSCDSKSICKIAWNTDSVAKAFFKSGLLTQIEGWLQFTAPIMRTTLGLYLFSKGRSSQLHTTNFEEFILRTIERMRPSILKNSLGRGTDYLLERIWQFEWYRTAMTAVPSDAVVSPDVGAVFGSPGYLDFYVNGDYA
ncbi:hypothetical protein L211DRAFT_850154 [Terfezia boudieri ATCC MYA-4762]|uniref:Uncharacterized protein n=1 Tax=Terfezia boudieri ATCC MYA-4762 TaxID=1051890 RepID=A0A3N4LNP2_9PEZI|nr:hypothetical protein L211DRAFT_850154 [Terfezia boudieri ATCC MYA-4762]